MCGRVSECVSECLHTFPSRPLLGLGLSPHPGWPHGWSGSCTIVGVQSSCNRWLQHSLGQHIHKDCDQPQGVGTVCVCVCVCECVSSVCVSVCQVCGCACVSSVCVSVCGCEYLCVCA